MWSDFRLWKTSLAATNCFGLFVVGFSDGLIPALVRAVTQSRPFCCRPVVLFVVVLL